MGSLKERSSEMDVAGREVEESREWQINRFLRNLLPPRSLMTFHTCADTVFLTTFYSIFYMCKHVLNAQVAIRSPCCRKWFDCAECHQEQESHMLQKAQEMIFACKKCKKCFRKDAAEFEESDEYCPHCDNHFVIDAVTPKADLRIEGDDARMDSRMLKDDRVRADQEKSIFNFKDLSDRMG